MDLCQKVIRNPFRLFQSVHDLLVIGIVEGIDHGIELLDELVETGNGKLVQDLPHLFIRKAVIGFDISHHRQEIQLLRVDFLEEHRPIGLADNLCH